VEKAGKRPERYVYQITQKGKIYFLNLLREHLKSYARTYYEDDVGITFMDQLSNDEVRQLLVEKREKIQALLQQFRQVSETHPEHFSYVIQHNIVHLKADLTWLNSLLSKLDAIKT
jgi:DNA-binding PadR family transcriptional regulator